MIIPSAEPFFLPGNSPGVLLLHGFTGAPLEMRWLGEYLNQCGYSVLAPRLSGHATVPEDLLRTNWRDWLNSAEDGWHLLKDSVDKIFIAGLSMGGLLSLILASRFPAQGVIIMSAPYELPPDPRLRYIKLIQYVIPFIDKGPSDWHDKAAEKIHVHYPRLPTRGIIELQSLLTEMRSVLPSVTMPSFLIHSHGDQSVDQSNLKKFYDKIGSKEKHMLWVENSGHNIPRDKERMKVFKAVDAFIRQMNEITEEN